MSYVFISYSKHDRAYVEMLAKALAERGLQTWYDESIEAGDRWWRRISAAIDGCAAFIVVMSPDAEQSEWVEREIMLAERDEKPIFPLLLNGREFGMLINVQFFDVRGGGLPSDVLFRRLAECLPAVPPTAPAVEAPPATTTPASPRSKARIPEEVWYSEQHLWVVVDNFVATMGITEFGLTQLGNVVHVTLPPAGTVIHPGASFATIETQKVTSDLVSPIDGHVIGSNVQLEKQPGLINDDPYGQGWLVKVRDPDWRKALLMGTTQYETFCKSL